MKTYLQTRPQNDIFDAFNDFFRPMFYEDSVNFMRTDIIEKEEGFELMIELPGFKKDEIKIALDNGYLSVSAEKSEKEGEGKYLRRESKQSLKRTYYVGDQVDEENVKAKYEDGVLNLSVPKKHPKKIESRSIAID